MSGRSLTFRVFVSSTFADMAPERNVLQEKTFPRLREYCRERGARFQAVDLRWGVSGEASLDQQTMNICLGEIRRCQRVTPRPNFVVLLGQRYGWKPPPPQVLAEVFERILPVVKRDERDVLVEWYRRDDNAVPPEYVLLPREPGGPYESAEEWRPVEEALQAALCRGAQAIGLTGKDLLPYCASATHQEIAAGALDVENPADKVLCVFRDVKGFPLDGSGEPGGGAEQFVDADQGDIWDLRGDLTDLVPQNVIRCDARWSEERRRPTENHLDEMDAQVYAGLRAQIDCELAKPTMRRESRTFHITPDEVLDEEGRAHHEVAEGHVAHFVGREDVLDRTSDYIRGTDPHPLVLVGDGGTGKSALMARAIERLQEENPDADTVYRFIGATPTSSTARTLLRSLCLELCRRSGGNEADVPEDYDELLQDSRERLQAVEEGATLVILFDGVDQIPE